MSSRKSLVLVRVRSLMVVHNLEDYQLVPVLLRMVEISHLVRCMVHNVDIHKQALLVDSNHHRRVNTMVVQLVLHQFDQVHNQLEMVVLGNAVRIIFVCCVSECSK